LPIIPENDIDSPALATATNAVARSAVHVKATTAAEERRGLRKAFIRGSPSTIEGARRSAKTDDATWVSGTMDLSKVCVGMERGSLEPAPR
jgi:hypothetical protein